MPNVVLLFAEPYGIRHKCYFNGQHDGPHDGPAVTSFSQPSCHSNEVHRVWQIDQTVGRQDVDCYSLHVLSPISVTMGDRMTADPAVDRMDTMIEKHNCNSLS